MILSTRFFKTPGLLQRILATRRVKALAKENALQSVITLARVRLPQYFFYSPRLRTVPRFSGNLQLLSTYADLPKLPSVCPTNAIRVSAKEISIREEKCIACGLCLEVTPEGLLLSGIREPEKKSSPAE